MMHRIALAILAITVAFATNANAGELGDLIKANINAKIAAKFGQKMDVSGPREINNTNIVDGEDNAVNASADGSQNLTIHYREGDVLYAPTTTTTYAPVTTTTSTYAPRYREETTYAPRYTEGSPVYAPRTVAEPRYVAPATVPRSYTYTPPRLTAVRVHDEECRTVKICVCVGTCGRQFTTVISRSTLTFKLLHDQESLPHNVRGYRMNMEGTLRRATDGLLYFTSRCPDGVIRTFVSP